MGFKEFAEKTGHLLKKGIGLYDKFRDWDNHNNKGRLQKLAWKGFRAAGTAASAAASTFLSPAVGAAIGAGVEGIYNNRMKDVKTRRRAIRKAEKAAEASSGNQTISTVSGPKKAAKIATNPVSNPISSQATAPVSRPSVGGARRKAIPTLY